MSFPGDPRRSSILPFPAFSSYPSPSSRNTGSGEHLSHHNRHPQNKQGSSSGCDRGMTISSGSTSGNNHFSPVPPTCRSTQAGLHARWFGYSTTYFSASTDIPSSDTSSLYRNGDNSTSNGNDEHPPSLAYGACLEAAVGNTEYQTYDSNGSIQDGLQSYRCHQYSSQHHGQHEREGSYSSEYLQDAYHEHYDTRTNEDDRILMMTMIDNNIISASKHRSSVSSNVSQSSSSSTSMVMHYQHQSLQQLNLENNGASNGNKHPCKFPTCGWSFKRFEHLKRHMLVHTKERPFICDFHGCEKSFSRSDNFSAHLRTHTKKATHMRRLDRQLMIMGSIHTAFRSDSTANRARTISTHPAGSSSGLLSTISSGRKIERRIQSYSGDHKYHQHSSVEYYQSSSPLHEGSDTGNFSHASKNQGCCNVPESTPRKSSFCCTSWDELGLSNVESKTKRASGSGTLSPSSFLRLSLDQHQHRRSHRHGITSDGLHPLHSPASDNLSNIIPNFTSINLDIKESGNLENRHSQDQGNSSCSRNNHYSASCGIHEYEYRHQQYHQTRCNRQSNTHSLPRRYSSPDRNVSSLAETSSFIPIRHQDLGLGEQCHQQVQRYSSPTGHESQNQNPNGESPTLTPRPTPAATPSSLLTSLPMRSGYDHSSATIFPASISSHFTLSTMDCLESSTVSSNEIVFKDSARRDAGFLSSSSTTSLVLLSRSANSSGSTAEEVSGCPVTKQHLSRSVSPSIDEGSNSLLDSTLKHNGYKEESYHRYHSWTASSGAKISTILSISPHHGAYRYAQPLQPLPSDGAYQRQHHLPQQNYQPEQHLQDSLSHRHHESSSFSSKTSTLSSQGTLAHRYLQLQQRARDDPYMMAPGGGVSNAKSHCCSVAGCLKRFKRLEHLKRHIKTHTLERPFACQISGCNKRFARSDNLSQHIKTHQRQLISKGPWRQ